MEKIIQEYVEINGINEYVLHFPCNQKPVLLFVHGGPGTSESVFGYKFKDMFQERCSLVFYDQRGTGRTYRKNPKAAPTLELLLEDLHSTVEYIKKYYHTQKIILMGHSWGTVLGTIYAKKHPENLSLYIGVGQVDALTETEKLAFQKLKDAIKEKNDASDLKQIQKIQNYPPTRWDKDSLKQYNKISKLKDKYGLSMTVTIDIVKLARKSPIKFTIFDFISMQKGVKASEHLMIDALNVFSIKQYGLEYKVPVCYLFGRNDYVTPVETFMKTYQQIQAPKKDIILIEDASHYVMFEQEKAFAEAFASFW